MSGGRDWSWCGVRGTDMAGAAWATPEVLERLFSDSFDSKGFVREGAVPVLAKGTFAVVFKVRAS